MANKDKKKNSIAGQIIFTLSCLVLGIIAGLIMKNYCPADINQFLYDNIFINIPKIFLNAVKMIVCLLVFVSVMLAIAGFNNIKTFGKIGLTVFGLFMVLSVFAMFLGWSAYHLFPIGDPQLANSLVESDSSVSNLTSSVNKEDLSIVNIIVNIVPSNFFQAFAKADMLQVIFIAVIFGIATIGLKGYSKKIVNGLETINELLLKVTRMIIKFMPIAIFFSMLNMGLTTDLSSMLSVLQ